MKQTIDQFKMENMSRALKVFYNPFIIYQLIIWASLLTHNYQMTYAGCCLLTSLTLKVLLIHKGAILKPWENQGVHLEDWFRKKTKTAVNERMLKCDLHLYFLTGTLTWFLAVASVSVRSNATVYLKATHIWPACRCSFTTDIKQQQRPPHSE